MSCYNTCFCKFPKTQKKDDRKQMVKDLKKRLTPKPKVAGGKEECIVPEIVMNRLTVAASKGVA